jgi:hypothetical protein
MKRIVVQHYRGSFPVEKYQPYAGVIAAIHVLLRAAMQSVVIIFKALKSTITLSISAVDEEIQARERYASR